MNRFRYLGEPSFLGRQGGKIVIPWYLSGGVAKSSCVAAYQPLGATSLAASYINLINPGTNDAFAGVAPSFNKLTGWTFNGTTQYLRTGIVPDLNPNTWSAIIRFSDYSADLGTLFGIRNGINQCFLIHNDIIATHAVGYRKNSVGANYYAPEILNGVLGFNGTKGYRNGVPDGAITVTNYVGNTLEIYIAARNMGGSAGTFLSGRVQAFAVYNTSLSDTQMLAISTAMAALNP